MHENTVVGLWTQERRNRGVGVKTRFWGFETLRRNRGLGREDAIYGLVPEDTIAGLGMKTRASARVLVSVDYIQCQFATGILVVNNPTDYYILQQDLYATGERDFPFLYHYKDWLNTALACDAHGESAIVKTQSRAWASGLG